MPRRWIDKKSATTYQLVFRPQTDPRIHDEEASDQVFKQIGGPPNAPDDGAADSAGAQTLSDLEAALGSSGTVLRNNEGEAAEHGVYFDDSEYDYMQHLRDLKSSGAGGSVWVEAPSAAGKEKGKGKSLDQALAEMGLDGVPQVSSAGASSSRADSAAGSVAGSVAGQSSSASLADPAAALHPSSSSSSKTTATSYQSQQDVPDAIAGFQPDMDPRLREVLEALDDEAYVDSADGKVDDLFKDIAAGGEEIHADEFEAMAGYEDDEGWETDDTARPYDHHDKHHTSSSPRPSLPPPTFADNDAANGLPSDSAPLAPPGEEEGEEEDATHGDGAFMASFRNLPKSAVSGVSSNARPEALAGGGLAPTLSVLMGSSALFGGGKKKRKGARTSSEAYSMTSSALARTEALSTLDARFEKTLADYAEEDEDELDDGRDTESMVSGVSGVSGLSRASGLSKASGVSGVSLRSMSSQAPRLIDRATLGGVLDEFLEGYGPAGGPGKKGGKKGRVRGAQTGMQQLDEIRRELGKPTGRAVSGRVT